MKGEHTKVRLFSHVGSACKLRRALRQNSRVRVRVRSISSISSTTKNFRMCTSATDATDAPDSDSDSAVLPKALLPKGWI
jgi:hypothetical protein